MTRHILIIDDDEVQLGLFAEWLTALGYDVRTARNASIGLSLAPQAAAVIVDARMPGIDGFEFLRRMRAAHPDTPAALITGDYLLDDAIVDECRRLNAAVVFKPMWLDNLEALTATLLGRSHAA
jgi:DNA-binding NtrC family response regulator